jgi:osmotically inducible protein OsmC
MQSRATAEWQGDLMTGKGKTSAASGTFQGASLSWKARTEGAAGSTTPEELLAAAHASCFSMALSHALAGEGTPPERLETSVTVTFQPGEGITKGAIEVVGTVPGVDQDAFAAQAEGARVNCPVSKALTGIPEVTVAATLANV